MSKFISKIDIFANNLSLNLNGENKIRTIFGGLLTLVMIVIGIVYFSIYFSNILSRQNPQVNLNKVFSFSSSYFLNTSETVFAFQLTTATGGVIDDKYYSVFAQYWNYNSYMSTPNVTNIKFSKCGTNFKLNSTEFDFVWSTFNFSSLYCLDPGQLLEISNPFGSTGIYKYINIYFTQCSNKTRTTGSCATDADISSKLTSYYSNIVTTSYYVDNNNFTNPLQPFQDIFSQLSSSAYFSRFYYQLQTLTHSSENEILNSSPTVNTAPSNSKTTGYLDFRNDTSLGGKKLFQFTFTFAMDGFQEQYFRSYKTIPNVLADVGGILNVVKLLFFVLNKIYYYIIYMPLIFEGFSFFSPQPMSDSNKVNNFAIYSNFKKIGMNVLKKEEDASRKLYNLNLPLARVSNTNNLKNIKLDDFPSKGQILTNYICICRKKSLSQEIFEKSMNKLSNIYLNVASIIQMRNEVSFLKNLLLKTKKEQDILSFASKVVCLNNEIFNERQLEFTEKTELQNSNTELSDSEEDNNLHILLEKYLNQS